MSSGDRLRRPDRDKEDTDIELLQNTQQCLRHLFQRAAPDSMAMWRQSWDDSYQFCRRVVERFARACRVPES